MSRSSFPIYISSRSTSPELAYPNAGNTLFPPASPTPFANNIPILLMNTHTSTPDSIPNYVQEYKDVANDLKVVHMTRMMGLTSKEVTAFVAMHQSVLEPFLCGVSPPPRPPTPPTPEPLPVPPATTTLALDPYITNFSIPKDSRSLLSLLVILPLLELIFPILLFPFITQQTTLTSSLMASGPLTHLLPYPLPPLPTMHLCYRPLSRPSRIQSKVGFKTKY